MSEMREFFRALVLDDVEAAERHQAEIDRKAQENPEELSDRLVAAAFFILTSRRFKGSSLREIVDWVAETRSALNEDADEIDPKAAEGLIRSVVRREIELVEQLEPSVRSQLQMMLTYRMLKQENLSEPALDGFLDEAEKLAAKWESQG
ncbi:MAG: hypothetical protein ACRDT4_17400 [Micromonosporaceae bacterium]